MAKTKQTTVVEQPEPVVELTTAEIAALEAEKAALLQVLKTRVPDEGPVLDHEAPEPPAPAGTSKDLLAEIERLKFEQHQERERSELVFNERIARLVREQQAAETREARTVNVSVQSRLKHATDALAGPVVDSAAQVAERERAEMQKQVDKLVKSARESLAEFEELVDEHRDEIDRLSKIPNKTWLSGLPSEGHDATRGYALAGQITNHLDQIQALLGNTPRAFENAIREVQGLVVAAPLPADRNSARYQSWQAEWHGATRDLGRMGGSVPTLNSMISNLALLVVDLAGIKKQYSGSTAAAKPIETDNPSAFFKNLEKENPNRPRPSSYESMAGTDLWSEKR
jgi:hypothetical protein